MAHAATAAALALLFFLCVHVHVDAADTLSQGQSLAGNNTLLSANGNFLLTFFTPHGGDPARRYLGVQYANAAEQTVPWVANRNAPVSAASGYSAIVTGSGELQVLEGERVVWRTNTSSSLGNITLMIRDTGNLVLSAGAGQTVWQSFDHPADTFIPGMSITLDQRNGVVNRTLFTSWRSPGDPATGNFTLGLDPLGSAQLYIWKSEGGSQNTTYWRSGQWTGSSFVGIPWRSLYVYGFKLSGDAYTFDTYNTSLYRFVLQPNGTEMCYMLLDGTGEWEVVWLQPTIECQAYNMCGPNAKCAADDNGQAVCTCLKGFKPKSEADYANRRWTQGCVRSTPLTCSERNISGGGDVFAELPGVKLPDFAAWGTTVGDADACRQSCLANCSCGAYSYSTGTSCLTWGQELVDIYQFPKGEAGYDLYIKVPPSVLGKQSIIFLVS